jgi:hypothetical protein
MTATDHREKGLASQLINHILADWQEQADGIFLFANSTTVDFYPKFGFEQTDEYQYALPVTPVAGDFRKLDMDKESDVNILKYYYQKSNPFSRLSARNNFGLLMFYCSAFMKHFVYYSENNNAVAIAMQNDHALLCFDIFCDSESSLTKIVNELAAQHTRQVILGFTPRKIAWVNTKRLKLMIFFSSIRQKKISLRNVSSCSRRSRMPESAGHLATGRSPF